MKKLQDPHRNNSSDRLPGRGAAANSVWEDADADTDTKIPNEEERVATNEWPRGQQSVSSAKAVAMHEHLASSQPGPLPTLILMRNSNFPNHTKDPRCRCPGKNARKMGQKYFCLREKTMKLFCDCFLPLVRDENKEVSFQMPVQCYTSITSHSPWVFAIVSPTKRGLSWQELRCLQDNCEGDWKGIHHDIPWNTISTLVCLTWSSHGNSKRNPIKITGNYMNSSCSLIKVNPETEVEDIRWHRCLTSCQAIISNNLKEVSTSWQQSKGKSVPYGKHIKLLNAPLENQGKYSLAKRNTI